MLLSSKAMGGPAKPGDIGTGQTVSTGGMTRGETAHGELAPGMMVGQYRIDAQIGEGGMGRVYAATHPVIGKRAAIKILHPELSVNQEAVERFIEEARSVNKIGHPNIVDIFAFETLPDGRCYFVMEFLRGQSLRDRLRATMLPLPEALPIIETISIALEAAHENGIVHRDLKPDNIFLVEHKGSPSQVKLLDFGIAKLLGNDGIRAQRTQTGNLLGTPAYMSPEPARGYAVDHRTDVYALGCVAYEMFTGWLPFPADNAADMIFAHLGTAPPSARDRNPQVPPELDAFVKRMLAKDPALRPSLAEVRDTMRRCMHQVMYAAGPPGGPYVPAGAGTPFPGAGPQVTPPPGQQHQWTQSALGAGPMMTPPPGTTTSAPAAGTQSVMSTGLGGVPAKKSRAPLVIALVVLAAIGAGVAITLNSKGGSTTPQPSASPTQPAAGPTNPSQPPTPPTQPAVAVDAGSEAVAPADAQAAVEPPPAVVDAGVPADAAKAEPRSPPRTPRPPRRPKDPKDPKRPPPPGEDPDAPM